jgi:hypothetical protein
MKYHYLVYVGQAVQILISLILSSKAYVRMASSLILVGSLLPSKPGIRSSAASNEHLNTP